MVEIGGIYTIRDTPHPYYWDVVYEWEDELAKALNVPLIPIGDEYDKIYKPGILRKVLNRLDFYRLTDKFFLNPSKYFIAFHIGPPGIYSFHSRKNVIPIIIDFWKSEDLKRFQSIFSEAKIVFITSREVFSYLLEAKLKLKLSHLALSLPDRMFATPVKAARTFDLIQIGRQNDTLSHFVKLLLEEHPTINYVYTERVNGKLRLISTVSGDLGEFANRESFLNLLRQSKVSLMSAPGMDVDNDRTGGFSPVTPRFLECAACGCYLIGIYPENEDFSYYGINQICENVSDYSSFKKIVLSCLSKVTAPTHQEFLSKHLTSVRANELKEKLASE